MTEPDEALLYARRSGVPVYQHQTVAEAYRAGSAASADRVAELEARVAELEAALAKADELCRVALPQFNWAASALDGQAVSILNEAPGIIHRALLKEPHDD